MKTCKKYIVMILMVVVTLMLTGCEDENARLKRELNEARNERVFWQVVTVIIGISAMGSLVWTVLKVQELTEASKSNVQLPPTPPNTPSNTPPPVSPQSNQPKPSTVQPEVKALNNHDSKMLQTNSLVIMPSAIPDSQEIQNSTKPKVKKVHKEWSFKKGTHFYIDGSNVCQSCHPGQSFRLDTLWALMDSLVRHGCEVHVVFDHTILNVVGRTGWKDAFEKMSQHLPGMIEVAPRGVEADQILLEKAKESGGMVISNDHFDDHYTRHPWIRNSGRIHRVCRNGNFVVSKHLGIQCFIKDYAKALGRLAEADKNYRVHSTVAASVQQTLRMAA